MTRLFASSLVVGFAELFVACSGTDSSSGPENSGGMVANSGGTASTSGGVTSVGGVSATGGATSSTSPSVGGKSGIGGNATGGVVATGGSIASTGGAPASGGAATGGKSATGGAATGGAVPTGGSNAGTGGAGTGGTPATGGNTGTGGAPGTCPSGGWKAGKQTINTTWGADARQYVVYIPKSYTGTSPVPLMMVIHGAHNTPSMAESWSQMDPIAEQYGFIIVYPAALDCWTVGTTHFSGCVSADDDVGFLNNIVTEVESHACIDTKRVYVTGISNGSAMSQYMGCHFANIYAAAGGVAGGSGCPAPARPLPIFYVVGTADTLWDHGTNALNWAKTDKCNTTPVTVYDQGGNTCIVYQGCSAGVEVEYCEVAGMPHCWPDNCYQGSSGYTPFKASPLMWQFFSQYSLP